MGTPNIAGTFTGTVAEDSGLVITGALTDVGNNAANTWSISSGATYGTASVNASGQWSYDLDDTNAVVNALGAGDTLTDTFVVRVSDMWGTDTQVITITITGVPCFVAGTLIETESGPRKVEDLVPCDRICTKDNGLQSLRWIGRSVVSDAEVLTNDRLRPILICAGALGQGLPKRDLLVSRQHRMLMASDTIFRTCGEEEVLLPAISLLELPGIRPCDGAGPWEYFHLLFDSHEIVFAEGAPSESLLLGPEALQILPEADQDEICAIFPDAALRARLGHPARLVPERDTQKLLVERLLSQVPQSSAPEIAGAGE